MISEVRASELPLFGQLEFSLISLAGIVWRAADMISTRHSVVY